VKQRAVHPLRRGEPRLEALNELRAERVEVGPGPREEVAEFASAPPTPRLTRCAGDACGQTTSYCSLDVTGGPLDYVPTLHVDYQ
jgi:hypothetical protein